MVTNLCPYNGNQQWCPSIGQKNTYGMEYHFDIMAKDLVFGNNVIADFEEVDCPGQAKTNYGQCQCANGIAKSKGGVPRVSG